MTSVRFSPHALHNLAPVGNQPLDLVPLAWRSLGHAAEYRNLVGQQLQRALNLERRLTCIEHGFVANEVLPALDDTRIYGVLGLGHGGGP